MNNNRDYRELEHLKRLDSPYIVKYIDFFNEDLNGCLVTEYFEVKFFYDLLENF